MSPMDGLAASLFEPATDLDAVIRSEIESVDALFGTIIGECSSQLCLRPECSELTADSISCFNRECGSGAQRDAVSADSESAAPSNALEFARHTEEQLALRCAVLERALSCMQEDACALRSQNFELCEEQRRWLGQEDHFQARCQEELRQHELMHTELQKCREDLWHHQGTYDELQQCQEELRQQELTRVDLQMCQEGHQLTRLELKRCQEELRQRDLEYVDLQQCQEEHRLTSLELQRFQEELRQRELTCIELQQFKQELGQRQSTHAELEQCMEELQQQQWTFVELRQCREEFHQQRQRHSLELGELRQEMRSLLGRMQVVQSNIAESPDKPRLPERACFPLRSAACVDFPAEPGLRSDEHRPASPRNADGEVLELCRQLHESVAMLPSPILGGPDVRSTSRVALRDAW